MNKALLTLFASILSVCALAQPVITQNPQGATLCMGECHDFVVAAVGTGLTYQWQGDDGSGFADLSVSSATSDTLSHCDTNASAPVSMSIRCVVHDMNGDSVISNVAVVTNDSCLAPVADFTYTFSGSEVCFTNTTTNGDSYLWIFGDGNTSNLQDPCNDYGTAWIYDVTLYAYNDYDVDVLTRTIDIVGIEEIEVNVEIYPNPASDVLYIRAERPIEQVALMNLKGEILEVNQVNRPSIDLVISDLNPGIYVLMIQQDSKAAYQRIVKL